LRRCGADNVVLILDACRGGQGSKLGEGIGNQSAEVAREKGVITFFSCRPNELSYELDDLQQGAFTKAFLDGLGIQGQCATVERLNHYLSGRVPELIRQHKKSDTLRQTPYVIAEPVTKSHLILCPRYATLRDVATMKNDAFSAEINQDFDLAEQLWIRVLAASSGDMDAIKALKRIAIAQHQRSAEDRAKTDKSPQPAPHNSTPSEPDVPLKSEQGVDYTNQRDVLVRRSLTASETGIETAKIALTDKGWSRQYLASRVVIGEGKQSQTGIDIQTVHKFFTQKGVNRQYFVAICKALGLDWQEIREPNGTPSP
jgi:hypothetical protein